MRVTCRLGLRVAHEAIMAILHGVCHVQKLATDVAG